ncbi:MAG: hypothetical protein LBG88_03455 [Christensenellaceae bacterium]|jgi:hypothetical protein|nr:hypothetical protein [Christensenellaceae bacterium]
MAIREEIDPYLDRLYNSNVRCPYCRVKILKYTTTCPRCGIHKKQIFDASNLEAKKILKDKTGQKIFKIRRRPDDVSFTRMSMLSLLAGFSGAHCFHVGRNIRGWAIVICSILGVVSIFAPMAWRAPFETMKLYDQINMLFPTDFFFVAALGMWGYDFVSIVFGFFKYPVRLGEKAVVKK